MKIIKIGAVHYLVLTVTDSERSREFYVNLLGFRVLAQFESTRTLGNNGLVLAVKPAPDTTLAIKDDCFNENRIELDHINLSVTNLTDLEEAPTIEQEAGGKPWVAFYLIERRCICQQYAGQYCI